MTEASGFHVLTKPGDATSEVEAAVRRIGSADRAGIHRYFFVSRARQTVLMATSVNAPIVGELRAVSGWSEPSEDEGPGAS